LAVILAAVFSVVYFILLNFDHFHKALNKIDWSKKKQQRN
jgi:hypothetical protein